MLSAAAQTFPFLNENSAVKDGAMDKRRAIQIMTRAADLYHNNLEDQKILFLYGVPSEVKRQIQAEENVLSAIKGYEVVFTVIIFCI